MTADPADGNPPCNSTATIMHSSMAWLVAARIAPTPATIPKNIAFVLNGLMLGGIIGMPLSHAIADSFGWQWSFILLGILALATSIIVGTTLPRLHATNQHDDSKDRRQLKTRRSGFGMQSAF